MTESDEEAEWAANERRLALVAYWQECADALANQKEKRNLPPPCDGPFDCEPV